MQSVHKVTTQTESFLQWKCIAKYKTQLEMKEHRFFGEDLRSGQMARLYHKRDLLLLVMRR